MERIAIVYTESKIPIRVVREALTLKKYGYEIHLVGSTSSYADELLCSGSIYKHKLHGWSHHALLRRPPYYQLMRRKLSKTLSKINPDVVFARNVYIAAMVKELDYPVVLDDAELFFIKRMLGLPRIRKLHQRLLKLAYNILTGKLEELLASEAPIITISKQGYIWYRYELGAKNVYIVRSYPLRKEANVAKIAYKNNRKHYVIFAHIGKGLDLNYYTYALYYDYYRSLITTLKVISKLGKYYKDKIEVLVIGDKVGYSTKIFNSIGIIPHMKMYEKLAFADFGLLTYDPSFFHSACSPLRAYMFAVSGVVPLVTDTLEDVINDMKPYVTIVNSFNFEESLSRMLTDIVENYSYEDHIHLRYKLKRYAERKLIWETQEKNIIEAVKRA
ncbi:MAG: hypothetical protein B6U76_02395 [Desulfurococcales archaeon ex4484_217_2]|nr:MAG: hypothetical protein B6U76_02395 [Desulfurococcales archaeon ex4484_217_2]